MTGYFDSNEASASRGKSLKLPLCLRVSDPSGSLTYQLTGWSVLPACLVIIPVFPLCSPLTVIRTLLPIILRSKALCCSRSDMDSCVGVWASRRLVSCSWRPRVPILWTRRSISSSSSSEDLRVFFDEDDDIVGATTCEHRSWGLKLQGFRASDNLQGLEEQDDLGKSSLSMFELYYLVNRSKSDLLGWLLQSIGWRGNRW